jgi:hypothetical protein
LTALGRGLTLAVTCLSLLLFIAPASAFASKQIVDYFGTPSGFGSRGGEFAQPDGIAVNQSGIGPANRGDIYVADPGSSFTTPNNRIQRFSRNENGTPANPYDDTYEFVSAWGADVDSVPTGGSDYEICTVAVDCQAAGSSGGNGTLAEPTAVAVDGDTGDVYVSDAGNYRIAVYDGTGVFLRAFGVDVVESGPDNTGAGYEVCVAASGDVCKSGVTGAGVGQIGTDQQAAEGIAVSQPDGNSGAGTVFLTDSGNRRVNTYNLDGTSPSSFGSEADFSPGFPTKLAVDSRGIVYVSDRQDEGEIDRYDSENADGTGVGFLASIPAPPLPLAGPLAYPTSALAVDTDSDGAGPDTDVLYVQRSGSMLQFGPLNKPGLASPPAAYDEIHGDNPTISEAPGLAIDESDGRIYISTGLVPIQGQDGQGVGVLDDAGPAPTATLDSLSDITSTSVTARGTIDPNGPPNVRYHAEYSTDGSSWEKTAEVLLGAQETPQAVSVTISPPGAGLVPSTLYHVRLVAIKPFSTPVVTAEKTFTTLPSAPLVETTGSPLRTTTSVRLEGRVNPRLADTSYHFEYGSQGPCSSNPCSSTPDRAAGISEVQKIAIKASAGEFVLHFKGEEAIVPVSYNIDAESVEVLLSIMPSVGFGNVHVTGGPGDPAGSHPYVVTFMGELANTDVPQIVITDGPTPLSGASEAEVETTVPGGTRNQTFLVSQQVGGLAPNTTYHYRVVADNGNPGSPAFGQDMTVTTRSSDAPLSHGHFPGPPGSDRAYELVSPADTSGNPLGSTDAVSDDGNRARYRISGGTPVSNTGSLFSFYVSQRSASGWFAKALFPPRDQMLSSTWNPVGGRADLSSMVAINNGGAENSGREAFWRLNTETGPVKVFESKSPVEVNFWKRAADDSPRLLVVLSVPGGGGTIDPQYPAATAAVNIYDVTSGSPKLASVLPDGKPLPCDANSTLGEVSIYVPKPRSSVLSPNGRRLVFSGKTHNCEVAPWELYLRDFQAETTELISGPVLSGPSCSAVMLEQTADAGFFWTQSRLDPKDSDSAGCAAGATNDPVRSGDVYRYDFATKESICVTCIAQGLDAHVLPGARVSRDGSHVYFESLQSLLPGAPTGTGSIYVIDVLGGELRWVAGPGVALDAPSGSPIEAPKLSDDGAVLVFSSNASSLDALGGLQNGGTKQYYRYDDNDRSLVCVSCPQDRSDPVNDAKGEFDSSNESIVAFSTPTPLVASDQNAPRPESWPNGAPTSMSGVTAGSSYSLTGSPLGPLSGPRSLYQRLLP